MALPNLLYYLTEVPWIVLISYWFLSALKTRSNRSRESSLSRYRTMLLVIAGLGQYWSARITIKQDHQLIRTGPYARLRHPIYSGLLLAMSGTAIELGQWHCLLGTLLVLTAYSLKARKEEKMLGAHFGEVFQEHQHQTGFLLPRFRSCC